MTSTATTTPPPPTSPRVSLVPPDDAPDPLSASLDWNLTDLGHAVERLRVAVRHHDVTTLEKARALLEIVGTVERLEELVAELEDFTDGDE